MNLERYETFVIEYFNCDIKSRRVVETVEYIYYILVLTNGTQFVVKEPKELKGE